MRPLTVTLPDGLVEAIEARVAAGDHASESDLVRDGLGSLLADDQEFEERLRAVVVPSCERIRADPSLAQPIEGVLERMQRRSVDEG